ncbi:MAG: cell wall hydrolase [Lachnospiraceae bacterium]|nr:cell wall hydrolase [Lachnospiraceae bacterium]
MRNMALRKGRIALLVLLAVLICDVPSITYATTTQEQLDDALKDKSELQDKIDEHNEQLDDLKDAEADLQSELKNLNEQLVEVSANLESLEQQIKDKEHEIEVTQAELAEARELESWQYDCMEQRIQYMYMEGEMDYLELFFSVSSISDFLNYSDYFSAMAEYDKKMLDEYEATRKLIEEKEAVLERDKAELDGLKVAAEAEKSKVAGLISQTSNSINKYGDKISEAEEKALAYEAQMKKAEEDIEALRKKIAEEKRLSQAAANAAWRDISEVTFADGDRALLAAIIYCEAGGEPYEGQLAVGAVVMNRVLSSRYPDTVVGVIYQKSQFSPVGSGRLEVVLASGRATESCYRAADEAMAGMTNVGNCLYFRTPIEGLTGINIGGHVFY